MQPILMVHGAETTAALLETSLRSAGFRTECFKSGKEALLNADRRKYLAAIVGQRLPDMHGLDVIRELRARCSTFPCVLLGHRDGPTVVAAMRLGPCDFIEEPTSPPVQ